MNWRKMLHVKECNGREVLAFPATRISVSPWNEKSFNSDEMTFSLVKHDYTLYCLLEPHDSSRLAYARNQDQVNVMKVNDPGAWNVIAWRNHLLQLYQHSIISSMNVSPHMKGVQGSTSLVTQQILHMFTYT